MLLQPNFGNLSPFYRPIEDLFPGMAKIRELSIMARVKDLRLFVSIFLSFLVLAMPSAQAYPDYYKSAYTIVVNPTIPLHKQTIEAISSWRKAKVNDNRILGIFPENYRPAASIYGQIDGKAEWVHDTQFFVQNPYLLVVISAGNKVNAFLPSCGLNSVEYSYGKITETYKGQSGQKWFFWAFDYYGDFKGIIRLWFVNAYDAGFKYVHVDSSKSLNIDMSYPPSKGSVLKSIYSGHEFFHVGHLRKNNISPYDERATIKLQGKNVKTVIHVKLWKSRPAANSVKEDFAYVVKIEP
jgi:hypothetical protein